MRANKTMEPDAMKKTPSDRSSPKTEVSAGETGRIVTVPEFGRLTAPRMRRAAGFLKESQDQELQQRVQLFLSTANVPALRHVQVQVDGDQVVLRGAVHTYYEKQLALEFSRRVAGVIHVVDEIEVPDYAPLADSGRDQRRRGGAAVR
jgi:hypothetical protein